MAMVVPPIAGWLMMDKCIIISYGWVRDFALLQETSIPPYESFGMGLWQRFTWLVMLACQWMQWVLHAVSPSHHELPGKKHGEFEAHFYLGQHPVAGMMFIRQSGDGFEPEKHSSTVQDWRETPEKKEVFRSCWYHDLVIPVNSCQNLLMLRKGIVFLFWGPAPAGFWWLSLHWATDSYGKFVSDDIIPGNIGSRGFLRFPIHVHKMHAKL